MKLNARDRPEVEDIQISGIEKAIINFATPFEYPIALGIKLVSGIAGNIDGDPLYKHGAWGFLVKTKTDDYKRLIHAGKNGKVDSSVLELYSNYLCGKVMVQTYRTFHHD